MLLLMDDLPHPAAASNGHSCRGGVVQEDGYYNQRYERGPDGSRLVATRSRADLARYYQIARRFRSLATVTNPFTIVSTRYPENARTATVGTVPNRSVRWTDLKSGMLNTRVNNEKLS